MHDLISSFTVSGLSQYRVQFSHLHLKITATAKCCFQSLQRHIFYRIIVFIQPQKTSPCWLT